MEVQIEKVVKAQKEAQSAAELADREEQSAHNKESKTTSSNRRTRRNTSRKWKLNSRRSVKHPRSRGQEPHPIGQRDCRSRRPSTKDAQEIIQFEQIDFEQVTEKRQAASQAKNGTNHAKQSGVSKNTQHNVR